MVPRRELAFVRRKSALGPRASPASLQFVRSVDPRPFAIGEGSQGVLLLHGLTGTPHDMRGLAEALHTPERRVVVPLLPGHTDLESLERATWRDWYEAGEQELEALADGGRRRVVVVGFSMGSLVGLRLAALRAHRMEGLAALSVPLRLAPGRAAAVQVVARLRRLPGLGASVGVLAKNGGPDVRDADVGAETPSLDAFPYPTLEQFADLQREVRSLLDRVRCPLLLLHGAHDHTAPPELSAEVAQRVSSTRVERQLFPNSFHVLPLDLDRAGVEARVRSFVDSLLPSPAS